MWECLGSFRLVASNNLDIFTYQTIYVGLFGFLSYCEQRERAEE